MAKIIVFCGHGGLRQADNSTELKVPKGATFNIYLRKFKSLANVIGQVIESGEPSPLKPAETIMAGQPMPNYRLYPPKGLAIAKPTNSQVTQIQTAIVGGQTVKEIIAEKGESFFEDAELRWAACRVDE